MAIKVLISRNMSEEQAVAAHPYLLKLAALAVKQPGYISGETVVNLDNPEENLIITSWKSMKDWQSFMKLKESKDLYYLVDQILVTPSDHKFYREP